MSAISVQIKGELKEQLEITAKDLNISIEDLVIKILKSYLRDGKIDKIGRKLRPHFKSMGIESEEDLFNKIS